MSSMLTNLTIGPQAYYGVIFRQMAGNATLAGQGCATILSRSGMFRNILNWILGRPSQSQLSRRGVTYKVIEVPPREYRRIVEGNFVKQIKQAQKKTEIAPPKNNSE